jgi:geranylgeranyl diphosphate synthase type II
VKVTLTKTDIAAWSDAVADVELALADYVGGLDLPENLREAVAYATVGGGKRLRPSLVLLSCEAVGGRREKALPAALAVELVHCFSLVHDDLPAMDDDALRRGRPTLHIHAGEAMAILAGDLMLNLAYDLLAGDERLEEPVRLRLVRELTGGTTSMIAGQVYDTLGGFPPGMPDLERLTLTHLNKTAALMRAACRMGGIAGDADDARLDALTRYGEAVGLMFQVVDDLLDVTQSAEHIGKATGKDIRAGKLTYPRLYDIDRCRAEIERLREAARSAAADIGAAAGPLDELCDFLAVRTR